MKAFADLKEHGAEDLLKREYGDAFQQTPEVRVNQFVKVEIFCYILVLFIFH